KAVAERYPELGLRARLVIAADTVESSARQAAEVLGYESWTLDYREVLNHPDVDVVSICAPNFLHKEMALAAAEAGKPFWIEKPMGRGAVESPQIARAAQRAGIVTGVGFNYRQAPAVQHARALIRGGRLGRITNVRCWLLADYSADPSGARTWRFEKDRAGTGVLGDLVSHGFDLAQFLAGEITDVTALTQTITPARPKPGGGAASHFSQGAVGELKPVENEDYVGVLARFASGAWERSSPAAWLSARAPSTLSRCMAPAARFAGTSSGSTSWRSASAATTRTTVIRRSWPAPDMASSPSSNRAPV